MKNIAVIFAGGTGKRMNSVSRPKQFLELNGKPVIIYTLEVFENHPAIDGIVVVCIKDWISFLEKQIKKYDIRKVEAIVAGGETGQESIFNGLEEAEKIYGDECNVLIHDGVRPLINEQTITDNIEMVNREGNCITCVPSIETVLIKRDEENIEIPSRGDTIIARAPQTFRLKDIISAHRRAKKEGKTDFIDSCSMMSYYGDKIHFVMGPIENVKITTPMDFFLFRALLEVKENQQIFGL
ncbi:MAG: 2-C-methyl-D-erythritol 4-phosphate cytidylyltransferase [Muribaculaceae bacterium]|nr:2-C-methyl-D-erythritol 4-phosphate cytidylyltransferase [Muribaculaceae bacterium]